MPDTCTDVAVQDLVGTVAGAYDDDKSKANHLVHANLATYSELLMKGNIVMAHVVMAHIVMAYIVMSKANHLVHANLATYSELLMKGVSCVQTCVLACA